MAYAFFVTDIADSITLDSYGLCAGVAGMSGKKHSTFENPIGPFNRNILSAASDNQEREKD